MHRREYIGVAFENDEHMRTLHRQYYAQYVTDRVIRIVARSIPLWMLSHSTDRALNDIPLSLWDELVRKLPTHLAHAVRENGDEPSLGTGVCVLKEAARQLVERIAEGAPHNVTRVL